MACWAILVVLIVGGGFVLYTWYTKKNFVAENENSKPRTETAA